MGDMPSVPNANVRRQPIDPTQRQAAGQGGRLDTGSAGRSVTVSQRAHLPRTGAVSRMDPEKKKAEFHRRFPNLEAFAKVYPALENLIGTTPMHLGTFIMTVDAVAAATGNQSYKALLLEFGPEILQNNLITFKIKQYRRRSTHQCFNTQNRVIANDRFAKMAAEHNYNIFNIEPRSFEVIFFNKQSIKNWKLLENCVRSENTSGEEYIFYLERFSVFSDMFPGETGFFRANATYGSYFREIFNETATVRFAEKCIEEFKDGDDADPARVAEIGQKVGVETFREIFLSQMRTEAESPDFKARPAFSRVMVQGLKTLYETGDADKALTALRTEAEACFPAFSRWREGSFDERATARERHAHIKTSFVSHLGGARGDINEIRPVALRDFVKDMTFCFFLTYEATTTPGVVAADIYDYVRMAPH